MRVHAARAPLRERSPFLPNDKSCVLSPYDANSKAEITLDLQFKD